MILSRSSSMAASKGSFRGDVNRIIRMQLLGGKGRADEVAIIPLLPLLPIGSGRKELARTTNSDSSHRLDEMNAHVIHPIDGVHDHRNVAKNPSVTIETVFPRPYLQPHRRRRRLDA